MKRCPAILFLLGVFSGVGPVGATPRWQGSDDFSSANASKARWTSYNKKGGYMYVDGGRVSCFYRQWDDDSWWYWGRKPLWIPTAEDWTIEARAFLPASAPADGERVKVGLAVGATEGKKLRSLYLKIHRYFSGGVVTSPPRVVWDADFRPDRDTYGTFDLNEGPSSWILSISHSALNQSVTYRVRDGDTGQELFQTNFATPLNLKSLVGVGLLVSAKKSWPANRSDLAADDWAIRQDRPVSLNLPAITKAGTTIEGSAWTLTIRGLGLTGGKFTGSAAIDFGGKTVTLPVVGSIRANGLFQLSGKGSKTTAGYSFAMLYDVKSSTPIAGSGRLTAPRQKAITF